jgi:hypothetical protein
MWLNFSVFGVKGLTADTVNTARIRNVNPLNNGTVDTVSSRQCNLRWVAGIVTSISIRNCETQLAAGTFISINETFESWRY